MLQNAGMQVRFWVTLAITVALALLFRPLSEKLSRKLALKHPIEEQQLIALGFSPLLAGLLLDSFLMAFQHAILPFLLISVAAVVGWGILAFHWEAKIQKAWKIILFQNLISAVMFIMVCIQLLGAGRFWLGIVGAWPQLFFVPFISFGFWVTQGNASMFPAYCTAFALMILASFTGCILGRRKRAGKKRIASMRMITWLLLGSIMGTWAVSMATLTAVTAQEMYDAMYEQSHGFSDRVLRYGTLHEFYDETSLRNGYQYERPDYLENQMLFTIGNNSSASYPTGSHYASYSPLTGKWRNKLIRNISYPMETAILFYDADGKLLHSSDSDVMYFHYYTQEEWDAGMDTTSGLHYGWIDISEGKHAEHWEDDPYLLFRTMYAGTHSLYDIKTIRVTGYFEGTQLIPVVMHYITETLIWPVVENDPQFSAGPNSYSYLVSDVDRTGKLEWQLKFDRSAEFKGKDLVTVYLDRPEMWDYPEKTVTYNGTEYESLAALTKALHLPLEDSGSCNDRSIFKLQELLVFDRWIGADFGTESAETGEAEVDFYLVTAIRSNPLACAVSALRNIYIVTGLLALILLLSVRSAIRAHLVTPVSDVVNAMEDGWSNVRYSENTPAMWHEPERLHAAFSAGQDHRRMTENEITRLKTALEYVKTAEQNRRQMTSNIAHELKTPLAIIHSYAEGLKEHIAEEKRDQYIDVILAEAERTDGMVLEMLDLSRLEAGKVKLSRDEFSLPALVKATFEKLEISARAKHLQIGFSFPDDFTLTADEGRIAQVIENFATNAIKYTPVGGHITVKLQTRRADVTFSIENDSEPLSAEALRQVWDTFYRTDESRSGSGTGLGLAIAKNIIELHGGTCFARNTKTGVAFGFTLRI